MMVGLATFFLVGAVAFSLARWLRLPVVPILLAGGVALSALDWTPSPDFLNTALELGLTFLVFAAGIELNPRRVMMHREAALWTGLVQFAVVSVSGFILALLFEFSMLASVYLGCALGTSSTLVVIRHLKQNQQMFEPFGRLVTGVLLLQDAIMIFLIVLISRFPLGMAAVTVGVSEILGCSVIAIYFQRRLMPRLVERFGDDMEILLLLVLANLFLFVSLVRFVGLPPFAGAFLAGFSLSAFPVNGVVRGVIQSLNDFFMTVFFVTLGALVRIGSLNDVLIALAFAGLVLCLTPPVVTLVTEWKGFSSRAAIESGLLLAQNSEFSLVLGLTGLHLAQVDHAVFSLIAMFTVTTMILTPFLATDTVTRFLLHWHPWRRHISGLFSPPKQHVLVLGFGSGGMWVIRPLTAAGYQILVVDDDPVVITQLEKMKVPCLRGDGSDETILARAGARQARLILASMRRVRDADRVLRFARKVPTIVRVFETDEAEWIRSRGGTPVLNSEAAVETFMEWYEKSGVDQPHPAPSP